MKTLQVTSKWVAAVAQHCQRLDVLYISVGHNR